MIEQVNKLKPCPFCGGEAGVGSGKGGSFVNCIECLASTNILTDAKLDEFEAVDCWNTRAEDQDIQAIKREAILYLKQNAEEYFNQYQGEIWPDAIIEWLEKYANSLESTEHNGK